MYVIISGNSGETVKNTDPIISKYFTKLSKNENNRGNWDLINIYFILVNFGINNNV